MRDILQGVQLAALQSLAATFTTPIIQVNTIENLGLTIATSGLTANTGTIVPQFRIYKDVNHFSEWIPLNAVLTFANINVLQMIYLNQLPPGQIQFVFTPGGAGPNGTMNMWASGARV
jgi:hypothetical protein